MFPNFPEVSLPEATKTATKQMVIAEKNPKFASHLQEALSRVGIEVHIASDGPKAFELCRTNPPDWVLVEAILPGLLGTELCLQLKKDPALKGIPVILMSQGIKEIEEFEIEDNEFRADDFILKPFEAPLLLDKISALYQKRIHKDRKPRGATYHIDEILTLPENYQPPSAEARSARPRSIPSGYNFSRYNPRVPLNIKVDVQSADLFLSSPTMNISKGRFFYPALTNPYRLAR